MREIVFDTETTGFGAEDHRVLEIGAVELINRLPTGKIFHTYLNPERAIDPGAERIHGISAAKVATAPRFAEVVNDWLAFVGDAPLVAHNAEFDMAFMTMELKRLGLPPHTNVVIDTLALARVKLPGQRHKLDALCSFYGVDNAARVFHGALLDAQLLAEVYVELTGGLQASFGLETGHDAAPGDAKAADLKAGAFYQPTVVREATPQELEDHQAWVKKNIAKALWNLDN